MPHCIVRYSVRLTPKHGDVRGMDAVAIYHEEREADEVGEPGLLIWRRLNTFSGPAGYEIKDMVLRGNEWNMDVHERIGPLQWAN